MATGGASVCVIGGGGRREVDGGTRGGERERERLTEYCHNRVFLPPEIGGGLGHDEACQLDEDHDDQRSDIEYLELDCL